MINISDDVIILRLPTKKELSLIVSDTERLMFDVTMDEQSVQYKAKLRIFQRLAGALFGYEDTSCAVTDLCEIGLGKVDHESEVSRACGFNRYKAGSNYHQNIKSSARTILFNLWCEKIILLPYRFNFQRSIGLGARNASKSQVVRFLTSFQAGQDDLARFGGMIEKRMNSHCWVWLHTTSWVDFSDISPDDAASLSQEMSRRKHSDDKTSSPSSISSFMSVILATSPENLTFSELDWTTAAADFKSKAVREGTAKRVRGGTDEDDIILKRMVQMPRWRGFIRENPELRGTKYYINNRQLSEWAGLFEKYVEFRQEIQGYEDETAISKSLGKLADYISYYLPQRLLIEGASNDDLVLVPKDFRRSSHVIGVSHTASAPTFLEYLKLFSHSNDTRRSWIGHAAGFFEWLVANYSDIEFSDIVGPDFKNPINRMFDLPKSKKVYSTNKKVFSRLTLPHLLNWLYSVEEFGLRLQKEEMSASFKGLPRMTSTNVLTLLKCSDFGPVPFYEVNGERFDVETIPLHILREGKTKGSIWLSLLRWNIFTLETGLRHQSTQWLDRNTWDRSREDPIENEVNRLWVSTDKTHDSFEIPILKRVRGLLLRQNEQEERSGNTWVKIPYERRRFSRFSDIEHLFRNSNGKDIKDKEYQEYWKHLMFSFQGFVLSAGLKLPNLTSYKPSNQKIAISKIDNITRNSLCPLEIACEHTPHSCRASFVTRRNPFICLESIAQLVGHHNQIVTQHYIYPEFDELALKLEASDKMVGNSSPPAPTIRSGPAFIKAKEKNSSLRKAFRDDRGQAISDFRIVNLTSIHNVEDGGLDLLRSSRAAEIVFRDTHICPIGEECPKEVIEDSGEAMRCGSCRFACKSVDHLPAIEAKRNALIARIQSNVNLLRTVRSSGDRDEEQNEIYRRVTIDTQEFVGWTHSSETLRALLDDPVAMSGFITQQPDIVKKHLQRVVKKCGRQEFLLQRILEADSYPSFASDELRLKASRLRRKILTHSFDPPHENEDDPDFEIKVLASIIHTRLKAEGVGLAQIAAEIDNAHDLTDLPQRHMRLGGA